MSLADLELPIGTAAPQRVAQVVLLIDSSTRVLNANHSMSGPVFGSLASAGEVGLHQQWHPDCPGECRFDLLLRKALRRCSSGDTVEWEVADELTGRLLRLHLTCSLSPQHVENERRAPQKLLTITDITRGRRHVESVVSELAKARANTNSAADIDSRPTHDDQLQRKLVEAMEAERRRISAELHDGAAQYVGSIRYRLEAVIASLGGDLSGASRAELNDIVDGLREAGEEIRRVSKNLAPAMLHDFGLTHALEQLIEDFTLASPNTNVEASCQTSEANLDSDTAMAIYRISQEAMQNVRKHSQASNVSIQLQDDGNALRLQICDDGCGFDPRKLNDPNAPTDGFGLSNMEQRALATGGQLEIDSTPDGGVAVAAIWPKP